jgi:uncharacterized protein
MNKMTRNSSLCLLWQCLDVAGHDCVTLKSEDDGWRLEGCAVRMENGIPCRLSYRVACDSSWRTRRALIAGAVGSREVEMDIRNTSGGEWTVNGQACAALAGCTDIDLGFTPATNLLPIRRLALAVGRGAVVSAAWLRFPELEFSVLDQHYQRTGADSYRYSSADGCFQTELRVQADGLVVEYPGLWRVVS